MSHGNLLNMFQENFHLMQLHGYSLSDLENMIPWERSVYINLLLKHLEDEKQRLEKNTNGYE